LSAAGNNIFLAGSNNNSLTIGTTSFTMSQAQFWVARFDNTGAITWTTQGKNTGTVKANIRSISEDAQGNFYLAGAFSGTYTQLNITQALTADSKTNGDAEEIMYSKYNAAGNLVWLKQSHGLNSATGDRIKLAGDKLYMLGKLGSKRLSLGGDSTETTAVNTSNPAFIAQMDTSGNTLWLKRVNDVGGLKGNMEIYVNGSTNIYITGSYNSFASLPIGTFTLPNVPGNRLFMAKTTVAGLPNVVEEHLLKNELALDVYPNPASGNVTIAMNNIVEHRNIVVTDIRGKIVMERATDHALTVELNISPLHPGIYFIRVGETTKKLVVQ
jgi:hypothetical protein